MDVSRHGGKIAWMVSYYSRKEEAMYQFFVENSQIGDTHIKITGEDVNHIKNVLRMKPGEQVRISNQQGEDYFCEIGSMEKEQVTARILYKDHESKELPVKIYLFQGLPKGDKMEWIIQKAVELGVYEIIPVAMRNCVVKLDEKKAACKIRRWQAIAESAAKQSKRSIIPNIHEVMTFSEAADYAATMDFRLLPYENERGMEHTRQVIGGLKKEGSLAVFIGPEGGFDAKEIEAVKDKVELLSLGNRILRTETAGMTMLSILLYHLEE